MFVLSSDITVGSFRFSGVHSVEIRRSLHSIAETATIQIPSKSKIIKQGKAETNEVITGNQFKDGDAVTIKLGYNGALQTEFQGFVKHRNLNMPLEVVCEGYTWLLRRNKIKKTWKSVSVKDLLQAAISGINSSYKINVQCDVDHKLSNFSINGNGYQLIDNIIKSTDGALTCFFLKPDTLWCGLVYTPYAKDNDIFELGIVDYRLGYNLVKDNNLNERDLSDDPTQVTYGKKQTNGQKISQDSDAAMPTVRTHHKLLNHVTDADVLKSLANEKAYRINYAGYEGTINAFLQPYATTGCIANIIDDRYTERNGHYLVEGTEITFGMNGARRKLEIGPKVGFANM